MLQKEQTGDTYRKSRSDSVPPDEFTTRFSKFISITELKNHSYKFHGFMYKKNFENVSEMFQLLM